jgi:hypothetical protein
MKRLPLFLAALLVLVFATAANAANYPELDALASHWAQRPVHVDCPTAQEWADDPWSGGAWAYTTMDDREHGQGFTPRLVRLVANEAHRSITKLRVNVGFVFVHRGVRPGPS